MALHFVPNAQGNAVRFRPSEALSCKLVDEGGILGAEAIPVTQSKDSRRCVLRHCGETKLEILQLDSYVASAPTQTTGTAALSNHVNVTLT